jgi:hypothetical protein
MRPQAITVAALVAVVALVAAIVTTAVTGASGAPAHSMRVSRVPAVAIEVSAPPCSVAPAGTTSAIDLGGVCDGRLGGAFKCVERPDLLALSIEQPFGRRGATFELTIVISGFHGRGTYAGGVVAQVTGLGNVSRWANRRVRVAARSGRLIEVERSALAPEPGTPATGSVSIGGRAECG